MATSAMTPSFVSHNILGNLREDILDVTQDASDDGTVQTRLKWVLFAEMIPTDSSDALDDPDINIYKNADTTTEDETDHAGSLFIPLTTASQPIRIRAIGW